MAKKRHLLSNANIEALSIVGKGANRKRYFLRKDAAEKLDIVDLSQDRARLVKADDWSVVYCVVAEPGWEEDAGQIGDQSIPDVWRDEDEIRKAAHRFVENGGLVNLMHETLDPYGKLVENAVALADFDVDGETIKKGSWYVAIKPNDDGKAAIENGTFTGVSVQGTATRTLVEKADLELAQLWARVEETDLWKAEQFTKPGTANISAADRKKLMPLVRHYRGKPHFFRSCVRDQMKHGLSRGHANRRCAVLKQLAGLKKATRDDRASVDVVRTGFLKAMGRRVGMTDEELAELDAADLEKSATFAQRIAQRELDDELPDAMDVLRSVIWQAYYPHPDDDADPKEIITKSLDEFCDWALDLLNRVSTVAKADAEDLKVDVAKALGQDDTSATSGPGATVDSEMGLTDEERAELDGLKDKVEALPAEIAKAIKDSKEEDEKEPTAEELKTAVDELATNLEKVAGDVKKLGSGSSSQPPDTGKDGKDGKDGKVQKSDDETPAWAGIV